jgi:hypothetical protein
MSTGFLNLIERYLRHSGRLANAGAMGTGTNEDTNEGDGPFLRQGELKGVGATATTKAKGARPFLRKDELKPGRYIG